MNTPYGIFNLTYNKWVQDEDGNDYWDYDYFKVKNTMENLSMIDTAGFKAGCKKVQSTLEVRERTVII